MFRYKANLVSRTIPENHSKISRLPSDDSDSFRTGMDPSKDSWVFSKDATGHRKSRGHYRSSQDLQRSEYDEQSYSERESSIADENMKVNVLYRGMVYRVRGLKILCSVIAAIILLLTAVVILGIWIILGANEDGSFYFPWSSTNATESVYEHPARNLSKIGSYLAAIESGKITPSTEIDMYVPSNEVEETLGLFKAVHPKPNQPPLDNSKSEEISNEYYYDDNEEYEELYYIDDTDNEASFSRSSILDPPHGFRNFLPRDYDEYDRYGNDFRVLIGGDYPQRATNRRIFTGFPRDNVFRPSPLITEYKLPDPDILIHDNPGRQVIEETNSPQLSQSIINGRHGMRTYKNSHLNPISVINKKPQVNTDEPENTNDQNGDTVNNPLRRISQPIFTRQRFNVEEKIKNPSVAQLNDDLPLIKEFKEEILPANQETTTSTEKSTETKLFFESGNVRHVPHFTNSEPEDPHRKFFIENYDSSEIIIEENSQNSFDGPRYSRVPNAGDRRTDDPEIPEVIVPSSMMRSSEYVPRISLRNQNLNSLPPTIRNRILRQRLTAQRMRQHTPVIDGRPIPNLGRHISPQLRRRLESQNIKIIPVHQGSLENKRPASDSYIAESITYPTVVKPDGTPLFRRQNTRINNIGLSHGNKNERRRNRPRPNTASRETGTSNPFFSALNNMYNYSKRLASTLIDFSEGGDTKSIDNSTGEFLESSFGLLRDYDNVFQSLPRFFTEPLRMLQLPSAEQVDKLNPFELSLMTWTFIDFWEFLIEKVGMLSKQDLQVLEMRLEKMRQQKDSSLARAFMASATAEDKEGLDSSINSTHNSFIFPLVNKTEVKENQDNGETSGDMDRKESESTTDSLFKGTAVSRELWSPISYIQDEERLQFAQYAIRTLFNFGKVYMRSDYAMDCMMLLFCKDINAKTRAGGVDGLAAKLKRFA